MATTRRQTQTGLGVPKRGTMPPASGPISLGGATVRHTTPLERVAPPDATKPPTPRETATLAEVSAGGGGDVHEKLVDDAPASQPPISRRTPSPTERRSSREPIRVDSVGDAAVKLATRANRKSGVRPKLVVPIRVLATANLSKHEAFVASLLDGQLTLEEVLDTSGMKEDVVQAAIRKLVELKLAKL